MALDAEIFTFDPQGDVILLLDVPHRRNDVINNNVEASVEHDPVQNAESDNIPTYPVPGLPLEDDLPNGNWVGDVPQEEVAQGEEVAQEEEVAQGVITQEDVRQDDAVQSKMNSVTRYAQVNEATRRIKLRVSSRHLVLASSVFNHMISAQQQGSHIRRSEEEIPLEGDDFDALQILLNIVHGFHKKVPRTVKRDMLCEVLRLVDKYEFHEVADLFTEMWFKSLKAALPQGPSKHLATWIYICCELKQTAHFESLTKIAILETTCVFPAAQEARVPHWISVSRFQ
ncbi:hypothetical protein OHC33_011163 [Knufia fluminis]|uniref:BTB domain-containing protein n=1 Tax=Knufia fluminis TaxID=191047 RepID=A0AAN8I120_9EURO|nr:hypothetical protein OHC33_011163 [Knufia fluminis]